MSKIKIGYRTKFGKMIKGKFEDFCTSSWYDKISGKVDLIFTSPPFPLNRKKSYGNLQGNEYIEWLSNLAPLMNDLLTKSGSIVMEMGNAWVPGVPMMSTLSLQALLKFLESGKLNLCQQFICYNPARLPSPAQWVNVERIRVKDSFTHVWWMSHTSKPKADNKRVLKEYSPAMKHLLSKKKYNSGTRPSEHHIGSKSFLNNNSGAIPSNVLTFSNTTSTDPYLRYCKQTNEKPHPARMPLGLADFFIRFLTEKNDLVFDPFGGSNTTGAAAEMLSRKWISVEPQPKYIETSKGRFQK